MRKYGSAKASHHKNDGVSGGSDHPHVLVPVKLLSDMQFKLDQLNQAMYQLSISAIAFDTDLQAPQ
jgi:hypothetical protein